LAKDKRYRDIITVSIKSANYENDLIAKGKTKVEPQKWENHFVHYESHIRWLQERKYKSKTPKKVIQNMQDHIFSTEYMMWSLAKKNPMMLKKLIAMEYFPMFFTIPEKEVNYIQQISMGMSPDQADANQKAGESEAARLKPVSLETPPGMTGIDAGGQEPGAEGGFGGQA
jgi:hypothetical protein